MKGKNGFTLIELMISICISSMLMIAFYSIVASAVKTTSSLESNEEIMQNGTYCIEYMKREIRSAEKIISKDKIKGFNEKYKNSFGFVIQIRESKKTYNYVTYYLKNGKIIRDAGKSSSSYPNASVLRGNNEVARYIKSISGSKVDFDKKKIAICLNLDRDKGKEKVVKTEVKIRCPVDY